MTLYDPIATPRGTINIRVRAEERRRGGIRAYVWGDHPGVPSPGDALLAVDTDGITLELVIAGAEIEPLADALLACVALRAEHDDYLRGPVTTSRAAA